MLIVLIVSRCLCHGCLLQDNHTLVILFNHVLWSVLSFLKNYILAGKRDLNLNLVAHKSVADEVNASVVTRQEVLK